MKRSTYSFAEKRAKAEILRAWRTPGGSPLSDAEVCARIVAETGWSPPPKKGRKALMLRYLTENIRNAPRSPEAVSQAPVNFYQTAAWRAVRYEALLMHGGRCQCCGASAQSGAVLHVDHIKPRSKYPHLALVVTNLQVLCEDCNLGKGARDETDWRAPTQAG